MSLIALLRKEEWRATYDEEFNPNWSDEELLSHIIKLRCNHCQLTSLPDLPNCQILHCHSNLLTTLPNLPNCQRLFCQDNQLTTLSGLPNCQVIYCYGNQFDSLSNIPNCTHLYCSYNRLRTITNLPNCITLSCMNNQLTTLPDLPNCLWLRCGDNQLPLVELNEWKIVWKVREIYLGLKYGRLWYQRMLRSKAKQREKLHLELLWSPETKFYRETEEYRHFLQSSQPK
jgi:hypothetical protein